MNTYTVKKGDTIAKVAEKLNIRPIELLLVNPHLLDVTDYIFPNQVLTIPDSQANVLKSPFICRSEYGPTDVYKEIDEIKRNYSNKMTVETIGKSVMGQPIHLLKIGTGKKQIFYSGGWHANEWHTTKFLMTFVNQLLLHVKQNKEMAGYPVSKILDDVTLYVVPLVNPDGVELVHQGIYPEHPYYNQVLEINKGALRFEHWSSNIRGVDLNHQWPAGWEIEAEESPQHPWPRHYSGTGPLTEPEAKAIYTLTKDNNFAYVLAFHSQGQVIYWGYRGLEPKESEEMVTKLSLASSYLPVHTADSDGGYKDWFIQETGRPGFTIEVGVGTNPLPFSAFSEIWSNNVCLALEGLVL
ncbi:M14 family metallopeptidase [Bacillus alkalicellulosilyticus]|uniref:M14 family metallopeptidase n=1 Tax=Alkalihalobacterium alkalicellulosilyticum TaxID=1912214 RepID=UPI0009979665|nr:M14 family metallopeptidase [Bacillus alkalicellulosilyticus]